MLWDADAGQDETKMMAGGSLKCKDFIKNKISVKGSK